LINQGPDAASNFLSTPDSAPAETELLFEPLAATETIAEDFYHNNTLMLSTDQAKQIVQFRDGLCSCISDEDKFQLYIATRDDLLSQKSQLDCFIASVKAIMLAECKKYKKEMRWFGHKINVLTNSLR